MAHRKPVTQGKQAGVLAGEGGRSGDGVTAVGVGEKPEENRVFRRKMCGTWVIVRKFS